MLILKLGDTKSKNERQYGYMNKKDVLTIKNTKLYYWERTIFPALVVWQNKYYDYHFLANNDPELFDILYHVFCIMDENNYYIELSPGEMSNYSLIVTHGTKARQALWDFIISQRAFSAEYEDVKIVNFDQIG